MLTAKNKIKGLEELDSTKEVENRLNGMGHVRLVSLDEKHSTIYFEYSSFRDMDTVMQELRKMGLYVIKGHCADRKNKNIIQYDNG